MRASSTILLPHEWCKFWSFGLHNNLTFFCYNLTSIIFQYKTPAQHKKLEQTTGAFLRSGCAMFQLPNLQSGLPHAHFSLLYPFFLSCSIWSKSSTAVNALHCCTATFLSVCGLPFENAKSSSQTKCIAVQQKLNALSVFSMWFRIA